MDNITKSLREYLTSVSINHNTLFNSDCGNKIGKPTSTCFLCELEEESKREMSIVIDIYPEEQMFIISAHPNTIIEEKSIGHMQAFEMKWNRSGFMSTLIVEEERSVIQPDTYCFKLMVCGFCSESGVEESVWDKYIRKIKHEYSYIEEYVHEILTNESF